MHLLGEATGDSVGSMIVNVAIMSGVPSLVFLVWRLDRRLLTLEIAIKGIMRRGRSEGDY